MAEDPKMPEPMGGAGVPEESTPQPQRQDIRNVWAIDVLVEEVRRVFPETTFYAHSPNWLAANKVVVFTFEDEDWVDAQAVFYVTVSQDQRADLVEMDDEARTIVVKMSDNAILYDTRDSFGLIDAALGLDREITPDDLTPLGMALASGGEGFIEEPPKRTPVDPSSPNAHLVVEDFSSPVATQTDEEEEL